MDSRNAKRQSQLEKHILGIGSLKRTKRRKALRLFSKNKFSEQWIAVDDVPSIYCKVKEL